MARRRDPERTRELLLQAAREELRHHGYRAASLDRILENAGVTKGALYHHFRGKASLVEAVVSRLDEEIREAWGPVVESSEPLSALVEHLDRITQNASKDELDAWLTLVSLAADHEGLAPELARSVRSLVHDWIDDVAGVSSREIATLVASALLGAATIDELDSKMGHIGTAMTGIIRYIDRSSRNIPASAPKEPDEAVTTDGVSRSTPAPHPLSSFEV